MNDKLKKPTVSFSDLGQRVKPKIHINIGSLFDIPTALILTGKRGETIINGGLGQVTGIIGAGNNYKSTITHYMMLAAADRMNEAGYKKLNTRPDTNIVNMTTYDTEINISLDRLESLASAFPSLPVNPITCEDAVWYITDKSQVDASQWALSLNNYSKSKSKDKNSLVTYEAFIDPYTKENLVGIVPSFAEIDSLTEFESSSSMDQLSQDLDSSDTNTYAMKQGAFKTKFLSQIPRISTTSNIYLLLTAHIGEKIDMATGPAKYNKPTKKLQYLKSADTIKGVSTKFTYLLHNCWAAHTASVMINKSDKAPEYPSSNNSTSTDLNKVMLTQLRGKSGPSGFTIELIVSQEEGVLPALTEFHHIKSHNRYGIEGNMIHYHLSLMPEVSLNRKTVRSKIDNSRLLRRAINITSELLQLETYMAGRLKRENLLCTPKELYEDIKALGYSWDMILRTREYWTVNQYSNPRPYLGVIDLLKMRGKKYFPYFLNKDKTLKSMYSDIMSEDDNE